MLAIRLRWLARSGIRLSMDARIVTSRAIGARIRSARQAAGRTNAAAFAREVGCQPHTLWRYETGQITPSVERLAEIARACGVRMEWLATGEGPMREAAA